MIPVINDVVLKKKTFRTAGLVGYVREREIVPQTHASVTKKGGKVQIYTCWCEGKRRD